MRYVLWFLEDCISHLICSIKAAVENQSDGGDILHPVSCYMIKSWRTEWTQQCLWLKN